MGQRSVHAGACTSRVAVSYRARCLDEEQVELTVDSMDDVQVMQLRVYDPNGKVVVERVVRSFPMTVKFPAATAGRYELEMASIQQKRIKAFTWSDWEAAAPVGTELGPKLPQGVLAYAFLTVSG